MKIPRLSVVAILFVVFAVFSPSPAFASGSCSATSNSASVSSDLESAPPSTDGLRLVDVKRASFGAYERSRLPFLFFPRYTWKAVPGTEGEVRTYERPIATVVPSFLSSKNIPGKLMTHLRVTSYPQLNLRTVQWATESKGQLHHHIAVQYADGPYLIGESDDLRIAGDALTKRGNSTSAIEVSRCVDGELVTVLRADLPRPFLFKKTLYNHSQYKDCKKD